MDEGPGVEDVEKAMDDDLSTFDPCGKVAVAGQLAGEEVELGLDDDVRIAHVGAVLGEEGAEGADREGGYSLRGFLPCVQGRQGCFKALQMMH